MTAVTLFCGLYLVLLARSGLIAACKVEIVPQRLVVRYGDPAAATCRAQTPITGMGWESTVGTVDLEEDITESNWTVPELKEWKVSTHCYINPEAEVQCTKELPVLVYKMPDSVTLMTDDSGPKAAGKKYNLTCHVKNAAPVNNLRVTLFRGDQPLYRRFEKDIRVGPQNMTYEWSFIFKSSDNGAQYHCEAELDQISEHPIRSQPVFVTVHYPPDPSKDEVLVLEGDTTLNCTTKGNPPPVYTWKSSVGEKMGNQTVVKVAVAGNYTCTAINKMGKSTKVFIVVSSSSGTFWGIIIGGVVVAVLLIFGYIIWKWHAGPNSII